MSDGAARARAHRLVRDAVDGNERLRILRRPSAALVPNAARESLGRGNAALLELPSGPRGEGRLPPDIQWGEPHSPCRLEVLVVAERLQRRPATDAPDAPKPWPDACPAGGPREFGIRHSGGGRRLPDGPEPVVTDATLAVIG